MKQYKKIVVTTILATMLSSNLVYGATFKDVPSNHWAYTSISNVADKGYLVGDIEGNYYPDAKIDKFEASKTFAKLAGYKYIGATTAELAYYEQAYQNNIATINKYDDKYSMWNTTANREIAYLLEKKIMSSTDLDYFVATKSDGTEALRALSKEEAAVFITRAAGKENQVSNANYGKLFADDTDIASTYRPYVYYLKNSNILQGDEFNKFNPKTALTKASFATMINKTLNSWGDGSSSDAQANVTLDTVTGVIKNSYTSVNTIQIQTTNGANKNFIIAADAKIYIDDVQKSMSDLKTGMGVTVLTVDGTEAIEVRAIGKTSIADIVTTQQSGIVKDKTSSNGGTVSILVKTVTPLGKINEELKTYKVYSDCEVTVEGKASTFNNVAVGDIVTVSVKDDVAYKIVAESKYQQVDGELMEKYLNSNNLPVFIVENKDGVVYELVGSSSTKYVRNSSKGRLWSDIKIGDNVSIEAEYTTMVNVYADGKSTDNEGTIEEINISYKNPYIVIKDSDNGQLVKYVVPETVISIYSLRLDSLVEVELDSREVTDIDVISTVTTKPVEGYIYDLNRNNLMVKTSSDTYRKIYFDENTVVVDLKTGKVKTISDIDEEMTVIIYLDASDTDYAKSISIVSN